MNLARYLHEAGATAIYPQEGLAYPALGLVGEAVEAHQAVTSEAAIDTVIAELGDVCWYLAAIARTAGIHANELVGAPAPCDPAVALLAGAGTVAEQVKKTLRGGDTQLPAERRAAVVDGLAQVLAAITSLAAGHGHTLEAVLADNLTKLADRAQRGVVHGDGDHR